MEKLQAIGKSLKQIIFRLQPTITQDLKSIIRNHFNLSDHSWEDSDVSCEYFHHFLNTPESISLPQPQERPMSI